MKCASCQSGKFLSSLDKSLLVRRRVVEIFESQTALFLKPTVAFLSVVISVDGVLPLSLRGADFQGKN